MRAITAVLAIALGILASGAHAQPVNPAAAEAKEFPAAFRGLWFVGKSCDDLLGFNVTGGSFGVFGFFTPRPDGKFGVTTFTSDVIVEAKPDRIMTRAPRSDGKDVAPAITISEIKDGHRISYWQDRPNQRGDFFHCPNATARDPHTRALLRFLRKVEILSRVYAELAEKCRDIAAPDPCAAQLIGMLDLNGDGKIAPAELTTFLRRYAPVSVLVGGGDDKSPTHMVTIDTSDLDGIEASTAIFGPFLTNIVFSNFDLDGNGFLTADEIALALKQENIGGGSLDAARFLSESRKHAEDAFTAVGGLSQMLGGAAGGGGEPSPPGHGGGTSHDKDD